MKIVITSNPYRDRDFKHARTIQNLLASNGAQVALCLSFEVEQDVMLPKDLVFSDLRREIKNADLMICLGGDGTLLHASKYAVFSGVPVLGVNIGTVGFMTDIETGEIDQLSTLLTGNYLIENRMMLKVSVIREGTTIFTEHALNDAVITKGAVARIIQLNVQCDGMDAMEFGGDGIILCTPTGSSAYNMSAGGPIVEPLAHNIIITPVCAHSMSIRPIVLSGNRKVTVKVGKTGRRNCFLSVDGGKAFRMNYGDIVQVEQSEYVTKLVQLSGKSFFHILNSKLI